MAFAVLGDAARGRTRLIIEAVVIPILVHLDQAFEVCLVIAVVFDFQLTLASTGVSVAASFAFASSMLRSVSDSPSSSGPTRSVGFSC